MSDNTPHLGLIGGLATRAGIYYYEQLQLRHEAAGTTLDLSLRHADVARVLGHVARQDKQELGHYLGGLANQLFDGGAERVAVAAVAPHIAIDEIAREARGPMVSLLAAVPEALAAAGVERVAVFGNRAVIETDICNALGPGSAVHLEPAFVEAVHDVYNDIALHGKQGTPTEIDQLARLAEEALAAGAQAIVLAGTDLSSFYSRTPPDYPYVDLADAHIGEIMADHTHR